MQARMSTPRTSAAAHEVAIGMLRKGLGIRVTPPVLRLLCTSRWSDVGSKVPDCLPMIIQPDDGTDTWLLCLSAKLPSAGKAELRSPSLASALRAVDLTST